MRVGKTIITPGYCIGHDPAMTREIRQQNARGKRLITDERKWRKMRTPDDIINYVEELLNKWEEGPGAVMTVETLESVANLLRVQLGAIKEKKGKKAEKKDKDPGWREVG